MGSTSGERETVLDGGNSRDESNVIATAPSSSLAAPLTNTEDAPLSLANTTRLNRDSVNVAPTNSLPKNAESTNTGAAIGSDPFHLERFVRMHRIMFDTALSEIQAGQKQSCWLWFILPTAPYIVNGIERGSTMNRRYALRSDDECLAFLNYTCGNVSLRHHYMEILNAIQIQLSCGNTMHNLFGPSDDVKAISSFRLFARIANLMQDDELANVCRRVLDMVTTNTKITRMTGMKRRLHWR